MTAPRYLQLRPIRSPRIAPNNLTLKQRGYPRRSSLKSKQNCVLQKGEKNTKQTENQPFHYASLILTNSKDSQTGGRTDFIDGQSSVSVTKKSAPENVPKYGRNHRQRASTINLECEDIEGPVRRKRDFFF